MPVRCAQTRFVLNYKGITYYTLPSDTELQKGYAKVLVNENVNWRKHVICSAHKSPNGAREKCRIFQSTNEFNEKSIGGETVQRRNA